MDGGYMLVIIAAAAANAARRNRAPVDEALAAERRRKFRATVSLLVAPLLLAHAAIAAAMAGFLLFVLILGQEPWTPFALFMTLGLAAASLVLALIGLLLLRDKHLLTRLGRASAAAAEAFHAPVPDDAKPKPTADPDMD